MGVALEILDLEELFKSATREPIVINDFPDLSAEDKDRMSSLIYTRYSANTDVLSVLPSCECGKLVGEHNVGTTCSNCHTEVVPPHENDLEPLIWMRSPNGVAPLINPVVLNMLSMRFERSGLDVIRWLCDSSYKPPAKTPMAILSLVQSLNIPRSYNNFVLNFDSIMAILFSLKDLKTTKTKKLVEEPLQVLIRENRKRIFSTHIPLPNRSLLVVEDTNVGPYADSIDAIAVDAIQTMASIDSPLSSHTVRVKENRTIKALSQLSSYYYDIYRTRFAPKEGIPRKHIFGSRLHFTFRAVIASITDAHHYDSLYIPWGVAVSLFNLHLRNKLKRLGYTPNQAVAFLNEHAQKYHPLLDDLFKELIRESKHGRIPVLLQRN